MNGKETKEKVAPIDPKPLHSTNSNPSRTYRNGKSFARQGEHPIGRKGVENTR